MHIELGCYGQTEIMVDLSGSGIQVTLCGDGINKPFLRKYGAKQHDRPFVSNPPQFTYELAPRTIPRVREGVRIWAWESFHYWVMPAKKHFTKRHATFTLARVSSTDYRLEVMVGKTPTQYVLTAGISAGLESTFSVFAQAVDLDS